MTNYSAESGMLFKYVIFAWWNTMFARTNSKVNNCQPAKQQKKSNTNKTLGGSNTRQCVFSGLFGLQRENSSLRQFTVNNRWTQMIYSFSSPRFCPALSLAVLPLGSENEGKLGKASSLGGSAAALTLFLLALSSSGRLPAGEGAADKAGRRCVIVTDSSSRVAGVAAAAAGVFENRRAWPRLRERRRRSAVATDATRRRETSEESRPPRESRQRSSKRGRKWGYKRKVVAPPPSTPSPLPFLHTHTHTPSLFSQNKKILSAPRWNLSSVIYAVSSIDLRPSGALKGS